MTNMKTEETTATTTRTGHRKYCAAEEEILLSALYDLYIFRSFFLLPFFFWFILWEYLIFMSTAYFAFCIIHMTYPYFHA